MADKLVVFDMDGTLLADRLIFALAIGDNLSDVCMLEKAGLG